MNFQKEKCPCPVTGKEQHQALMHSGDQLVKNQLCREGPGGTGEQADHEIPRWPCSKEVQDDPGMHYAEYCHQVRSSFSPSHLITAVMRHTWSILFWIPQSRRDMDLLEQVHQHTTKITKIIKALKNLSYKESLRSGSVQLGEERSSYPYSRELLRKQSQALLSVI